MLIFNPLVSFTSNTPIITCIGGVHDSFKKFITRAFEMSTMPLDFHKIKLVKTMTIGARFGTTCKSKVFFTIIENISFTRTI
jgi:hypothetical protein